MNEYVIHLRSKFVVRPTAKSVIATRTATRPSMASFDQAFLVADVSLVFGRCGSAVAWSVNTSTRVWRSKADEVMAAVSRTASNCGREVIYKLEIRQKSDLAFGRACTG